MVVEMPPGSNFASPESNKISLDPPIPSRPLAFRWHCPPRGPRGAARGGPLGLQCRLPRARAGAQRDPWSVCARSFFASAEARSEDMAVARSSPHFNPLPGIPAPPSPPRRKVDGPRWLGGPHTAATVAPAPRASCGSSSFEAPAGQRLFSRQC